MRRWLRWIIKGRQSTAELQRRITLLEGQPVPVDYSQLYKDIEAALVEMRANFDERLKAMEERLDMPQKRKPSGRPFTILRKLAEQGEIVAREKNAG